METTIVASWYVCSSQGRKIHPLKQQAQEFLYKHSLWALVGNYFKSHLFCSIAVSCWLLQTSLDLKHLDSAAMGAGEQFVFRYHVDCHLSFSVMVKSLQF